MILINSRINYILDNLMMRNVFNNYLNKITHLVHDSSIGISFLFNLMSKRNNI